MIDWLAFTAASVVSNTPLPIAFDPVLLHFAKTHPGDQAWVAAAVGALGAGIGGICEMAAFRVLRRHTSFDTAVHRAPSGPWFYPWTAAMAMTPVPFTVVRVAAYLGHARPALYGLAIVIGRLPRHAAIVFLASALTFPRWLVPLTLVLAFTPLLWILARTNLHRQFVPTSTDSPHQPHRQSARGV